MAREYTFNTLRIVIVRNDDIIDDDEFTVQFLADGVPTKMLSREKRREVGAFFADFIQRFTEQAVKEYEANHSNKG